jgi:hypothetical protein
MAGPSLTYLTTTIDLPMVGENGAKRSPVMGEITRTTAAGYERVQRFFRKKAFELTFPMLLRSLYDSIEALVTAATDAGAFPTFSYTDLWPDADDVSVRVELGTDDWTIADEDYCSCSLRLVETNPRTTAIAAAINTYLDNELATPGIVGYWPMGEASGVVAASLAEIEIPDFDDDFTRADGVLRYSPSRHGYVVGGAWVPKIISNRMGCDEVTPGEAYLMTDLGATPSRFGGHFSFTSADGVVAMACFPEPAWVAGPMVHLSVSSTAWSIFAADPWPSTVPLLGGSFSPALAIDGTVYPVYFRFSGSTLTVELPDGTEQSITDSHILWCAGRHVFWEVLGNLGADARWDDIAAQSACSATIPAVIAAGATLGNPALMAGDSATSIAMTGGTEMCGLPYPPWPARMDDWSVKFWFAATVDGWLWQRDSHGNTSYDIIYLSGGSLVFLSTDNAGIGGPAVDGNPHQVVLTRARSGACHLYVDGALAGSSVAGTAETLFERTTWGGRFAGFTGQEGHFSLVRRVLTAAEVAASWALGIDA